MAYRRGGGRRARLVAERDQLRAGIEALADAIPYMRGLGTPDRSTLQMVLDDLRALLSSQPTAADGEAGGA